MLATIIEWDALGRVVGYAFAGTIALTMLFTAGILLVERGDHGAVVARRALGTVLLLASLGLVAFGLYVMFTTK